MSDKIRRMLIDLFRDEFYAQVTVCEVKSVDEEKLTANVVEIDSEVEIFDVRLNAGASTKKIVEIPKIGSIVLVGLLYNNRQARYVVRCSEIDKLIIDANISVIFNGGENGGLCITPTLIEQLNKTNELLTGLINVINGSPITEPGNGAPSALQTALRGAIAGKLLGDYSNVENEKVKH